MNISTFEIEMLSSPRDIFSVQEMKQNKRRDDTVFREQTRKT
jgi:hypothetical protein